MPQAAISPTDGMPAPKDHHRKMISVPLDMRDEIVEFRHAERLKTENAAYQELLRKGLEAYRREKAAGATKKPKG